MTWLSTLGNNSLALHSQLMVGCNHMDHGVLSHQSSLVMLAVRKPWLCSGLQWPRVWLPAQWRECWLVRSPFSTGLSSEMTSRGDFIYTLCFIPESFSIFESIWLICLSLDMRHAIKLLSQSRPKSKIWKLQASRWAIKRIQITLPQTDHLNFVCCVQVIQIDEAALREGLPLRKSEQAFYLDWAVHSFRITNCGVKDTTQVSLSNSYTSQLSTQIFLVLEN